MTTSTGCASRCAYCAIWMAKGRLVSRPLEDVLADVTTGLDRGFTWVSLIADDNGAYGKDIGRNFGELVDGLTALQRPFGLMIEGIKPDDFNDHFETLLRFGRAGNPLGMVLTVQHAHPRLLQAMGRPFDLERFKRNLARLDREITGLVPSFHLIGGFPGEGREELAALEDFARWVKALDPRNGYAWVTFVFSAHPGTRAFSMPDQIPLETRIARCAAITAVHEDVTEDATEEATQDPAQDRAAPDHADHGVPDDHA